MTDAERSAAEPSGVCGLCGDPNCEMLVSQAWLDAQAQAIVAEQEDCPWKCRADATSCLCREDAAKPEDSE